MTTTSVMHKHMVHSIGFYVTVHAKRYHKSAKMFFQITVDFAFIGPPASSLQIWGV